MPSCHPALLVGEILLHIFSNLPEDDLFMIALTCCTWSDPALDLLWKDIRLADILKVLSPIFEDSEKMPLPLLPNVTELHWGDLPDLSLAILGDGLREVYLTLQLDGDTHPRFFSRAAILAPNITVLYISEGDALSQSTLEGLLFLVQRLQNLQEIAIYASEVEDIRPLITVLSELPVLKQVEIRHPGQLLDAWTPPSRQVAPLPSLSDLRLAGGPVMAGVPVLLRSMAATQPSHLTHFTMGGYGGCISDVEGVLESLGAYRGLRSIVINAGFRPQAPIGACSNLEALEIHLRGPVEVSDEEIERLLSGLPKLETLALRGGGPVPPILTIKVLLIIVAACPFMKKIDLSGVDASRDVIPPQYPFKAGANLVSIAVGVSRIQDAKAVAVFLERLSGGDIVKIVTAYRDTSNEQKTLWDAVAEWMPVLRQAREYGR
ncbi:hypothetical protein FRB97_001925 [Tulasnella sp. 331]|nr:hypothetical protein FRB97_001925 [Tulasnella sp. 331]